MRTVKKNRSRRQQAPRGFRREFRPRVEQLESRRLLSVSVSGYTQSQAILAAGAVSGVDGSGFISGSTVEIGGATWANVSYVNSTQLNVTLSTMSNANAVYVLQVVNPDATTALAPHGVAYGRVLGSAVPSDVQLSGGAIMVYGGGFQSNTTFTIGGAAATSVTIVSPTQATMTAPARTSTGTAAIAAVTSGSSFAGSPQFGYAAPYMSPYFGYSGVQALQAKYNNPMYANYKRVIHDLAQEAMLATVDASEDDVSFRIEDLLWGYLCEGNQGYFTALMAEATEVATVVGWPDNYGWTAGEPVISMAEAYNALASQLSASQTSMFLTYLEAVTLSGPSYWTNLVNPGIGTNLAAVSAAAEGMAGMDLLHVSSYASVAQSAVTSAVSLVNSN